MRRSIAVIVGLWLQGAFAQTPLLDGQVSGLTFGDTLETVQGALESVCTVTRTVSVYPPSFPLAQEQEQHLICNGYSTAAGDVQAVAFTFADNKLVMLHADGNAAAALLALAKEPQQTYLHFVVSFTEGLVVDKAADQAWVLSPEALHAQLFQWPNPYVKSGAEPRYFAAAVTPDVLQFGSRLEDLKPLFEKRCRFVYLDTYDVWLLNQPNVQQQIDCFGYEFAGFPRKIEAVFGDGILEQAWILTGKGEEARVRKALIEAFGAPVHVDDNWEIFDDNHVMLRKDKPEVLMLSDDLAPLYRQKVIDSH